MDKRILLIYDNKYELLKAKLQEKLINLQLCYFDEPQNYNPIHDFIIEKVSEKNCDVILIQCSISNIHTNYLGIDIGLHIRLTSKLQDKMYLPLVFLTADSYKYISHKRLEADLLISKGCYTIIPNIETILDTIGKVTPINKEVYYKEVLPKITINKPQEYGNHSLANEWGVYRLAEAANLNSIKKDIIDLLPNINDIYVKFILRKSENIISKNETSNIIIQSSHEAIKNPIGKPQKCLLIDDQAELGWVIVLKGILKELNSQNSIEYISNFHENDYETEVIEKIRCNDFDLIFLDLRLLSYEDTMKFELVSEISKFSGAKLLKCIKEYNPAIQIIMFTASNKAWNIERLFDLGADGFYIKESPNIALSNKFSKENYLNLHNSIVELTKRGEYLKWYWSHINIIEKEIRKKYTNTIICDRICEKLKMSFGLLRIKQKTFDKNFIYTDFELTFLTLWSCLNEFVSVRITEDYDYNKRQQKSMFVINNGEQKHIIKFLGTNEKGEEIYKTCIESYSDYVPSDKYKARFRYEFKTNPDKTINSYRLTDNFDKTPLHSNDLSFQLSAYLLINNLKNLLDDFHILNHIRNKLDYTHPNKNYISKYTINKGRDTELAKKDCIEMFKFLFILFTDCKIEDPQV